MRPPSPPSVAFLPITFSAPFRARRVSHLTPTMTALKGRNAVITGATRGIGQGIAVACGEQGANVFITGRTESGPTGSLQHVANLVRKAGGNCEYFVVDHADDAQVADMFEKLKARLDANGATLDLFVNNAYAAVNFLMQSLDFPFWEKSAEKPDVPDAEADPAKVWDLVNGVGLRNHYVCSTKAMRIMVTQGSGLIVNITSWGGTLSIFDPAYSIGKEAIDRMSAEIGQAAPKGVRCIALCPGYVTTEALVLSQQQQREKALAEGRDPEKGAFPAWNAETPLFVGRVVAAIAAKDGTPFVSKMNGKVVVASEAAEILGVKDEKGFRALSFRAVRLGIMTALPFMRESPLRHLVPRRLCFPWFLTRMFIGAKKYW